MQNGPARLAVTGGTKGDGAWEDTVARASWSDGSISWFAAARLGMAPVALSRMAAGVEWALTPDWFVSGAIEYDFRTGSLVQLEGGIVRSIAGCLRLGLAAHLGGIRLSLEVPAFAQAKVRFSPLDEGLRLGD